MGRLSKDDKKFIIECIQHNRDSYTQKATKYFDMPDYKEKIFKPTVDKMNTIIDILRGVK